VERLRPIVAFARATPGPEEVTSLVKLQYRGSRNASLSCGRVCRGVFFTGFKSANPMDDPDMVGLIDRDADSAPEDPMVRQRPRPERIYFKYGGLHTGGFHRNFSQMHTGLNPKRGKKYCKRCGML
jgi:hypothetical protein